jgi:hypothetical protein
MPRTGTSVLIAGALVGLLGSTPALAGAGGFLRDPVRLAQAQTPGEREISLGEPGPSAGTPAGLLLQGLQVSGFAVGSASWNSAVQMVPEFAGGAQALAEPDQINFRFDKVGVSLSRRFAPWLSASAAIEIESHKDKHSHLRTTAAQCGPASPVPCESFGAETPATESTLDKLAITAIAPIGTGLGFSLGRFDVPFGIERHDEVLNLTATTSEIYQFAKPQNYTGLQTFYQFAPWLDVNAWVANRWESHTTHDPFDDNNSDKSYGARIGISPITRGRLLAIGVGGWYGAERANPALATDLGLNGPKRWVVDADLSWSPAPRLTFAAEAVYGEEENVSFRARGFPVEAPAVSDITAGWWGGFVLAHYEALKWLGLTLRYGYLDDMDGWRTGVDQTLQSVTVVPTVHLSALVPDLRPMGATFPRTSIPIHWLDLKVEYRYNRSSDRAFSDAPAPRADLGAQKDSHQVQVQAVVNF